MNICFWLCFSAIVVLFILEMINVFPVLKKDASEEEKIKLCEIVTLAGADYIKTSTGFSKGGATFDDVKLMVNNVGEGVKVKAAGGISGLEDAEKFIELGAKTIEMETANLFKCNSLLKIKH